METSKTTFLDRSRSEGYGEQGTGNVERLGEENTDARERNRDAKQGSVPSHALLAPHLRLVRLLGKHPGIQPGAWHFAERRSTH